MFNFQIYLKAVSNWLFTIILNFVEQWICYEYKDGSYQDCQPAPIKLFRCDSVTKLWKLFPVHLFESEINLNNEIPFLHLIKVSSIVIFQLLETPFSEQNLLLRILCIKYVCQTKARQSSFLAPKQLNLNILLYTFYITTSKKYGWTLSRL